MSQILLGPMTITTDEPCYLLEEKIEHAPGFKGWQRVQIFTVVRNDELTKCRVVLGKAKDFYCKVLGWTFNTTPMGDFEYTVLKVGERDNGGIMPMAGPMWEGVPAHWMVYFAVADTDAICKKIEELGGKVCVPPTDIPVGRFAVVNDPQGAMFSVIKLNRPM